MRTCFVSHGLGMALSVALLVGCNPGPDLSGVRDALEAGGQLAAAGSMALRAVTDAAYAVACVKATTQCSTYPCTGGADITIGPGCPLPFGDGAQGTVKVTGSVQSAYDATFSTTFIDVQAGSRSLVVVSSTQLSVSRGANATTVTYSGQTVNTGSGSLTSQSAYSIDVDERGTADPSDDVYTMNGGNQSVGGLSVDAFGFSNVRMEPTCRRNPVSGSATLQHVSTFSLRQDVVDFHRACDGKVEANGDSVDLE